MQKGVRVSVRVRVRVRIIVRIMVSVRVRGGFGGNEGAAMLHTITLIFYLNPSPEPYHLNLIPEPFT